MIGHLLGAAGAVEFITCVKEIQDGFIHKTVGYETPDEEIDLNYCKDSYEEPVEYALSNSLGFGGHNASILLSGSTLLSAKRVDKLFLLFRGFAHLGCEVRWSTQYIPREKYEVSHGILHGQAVIWC